jgi:DNA-binding CsgD family transcriptional regulator
MSSRLQQQCIDVMHTTTVKSFLAQLIDFVGAYEFNTVSATVITEHSPTLTEFQSCSNVPAAYLDGYYDLAAAKRDPVSQFCKNSSLPLVWDQQTYEDAGCMDLWDEHAPFGLKHGISLAIHLPHGRHFFFGAMCEKIGRRKPHELRNMLADLYRFASHAQAAAFEISSPTLPNTSSKWGLTKSELEALRWTMAGNTDWEIGKAMSISESMVLLRLRNAMRKLGCGTKYEAVLRAIRLGLITCE